MERPVKHLSKKLFCLLTLAVSFTAHKTYAVTGGFEPGFDANGVFGSTTIGTNYFVNSIVGRGRIHVSPNNPDTVDPSVGRSNDHRELSEDSATSMFTDMTWMIGYNYYQSSGTNAAGESATDDAQTIRLGIALDLGDAFDFLASGTYQVIPEENFSQGIFDIDMGYYISLAKDTRTVKIEGDDAESYYLRKAKEQEQIVRPAKEVFPSLKVGFHMMFTQDRKSPTDPTTGRVDGTLLTGDQLLNIAGSGPYVVYNLSRLISFKLSALIYYYDTNVEQFLANNTIGNARAQEGLALADMDDTTPLLMTYPDRSMTGTVNFQLGPKTSLRGAIQEATYSGSIGGSNTTSIGAIVSQQVSNVLRIGVQLDETAGGGGPFGSSTTGTVGGVSLGYLF
jgi:hypothetical protein